MCDEGLYNCTLKPTSDFSGQTVSILTQIGSDSFYDQVKTIRVA